MHSGLKMETDEVAEGLNMVQSGQAGQQQRLVLAIEIDAVTPITKRANHLNTGEVQPQLPPSSLNSR